MSQHYDLKTVTCSVCGRIVLANEDGTATPHNNLRETPIRMCKGSNKKGAK
jgi:hypothetical protein